ncbi:MAG: 16S rRNA processing protein RimM [Flavobacteriales bacterium]|nr:16S rRNA processing protein RimM [Flavobacteriales bacterium]
MNSSFGDCFYLGKIVRKHGFKGDLVLKLDTDVPESYAELESLFLDMSGTMVPFFIERSLFQGQFIRVKFEGVDSEQEAEKLLRKEAYLPIECLPELGEGQFYYHEIVGYRVVDKVCGDIGEVKGVNDSSAQALFEIENDGVEILLPMVDDFIEKVDKASGVIYVDCPEGLVDLYMNPTDDKDE